MTAPTNPDAAKQPLPYPVSLKRRDLESEPKFERGGLETFETPAAHEINRARMDHLGSLGLDLASKTVLDVGCGVGHLAQFFTKLGCRVTCIDARPTNIEGLRARYPVLEAQVHNVEVEPLPQSRRFDVVFCYGLLYHLENPLAALRNMEAVCNELLLLETLICDHGEPVLMLADESVVFNQALMGLGCRPSPSYVVMALNRAGFPYVYAPKEPPAHPEFRFEWQNDLACLRHGVNMRCVFVGSRRALDGPTLVSLLPEV